MRSADYKDLSWRIILVFWKKGGLWEVVTHGGLTVCTLSFNVACV